jgi:O-methyltransferase
MDNFKVMLNVASVTPPGKFVEIGVYQGGSAYVLDYLAKVDSRELHLFDTFCGMPVKSDVDRHEIGDFADTNAERVKQIIPDAFFHIGMFPDTLPHDLRGIAFAHVDCDQYESVKAACMHLPRRMVRGGIIYFDDYGCLAGATQAVDEVLPKRIVLQNGKAMYVVH